jgi:hypothetical protein
VVRQSASVAGLFANVAAPPETQSPAALEAEAAAPPADGTVTESTLALAFAHAMMA